MKLFLAAGSILLFSHFAIAACESYCDKKRIQCTSDCDRLDSKGCYADGLNIVPERQVCMKYCLDEFYTCERKMVKIRQDLAGTSVEVNNVNSSCSDYGQAIVFCSNRNDINATFCQSGSPTSRALAKCEEHAAARPLGVDEAPCAQACKTWLYSQCEKLSKGQPLDTPNSFATGGNTCEGVLGPDAARPSSTPTPSPSTTPSAVPSNAPTGSSATIPRVRNGGSRTIPGPRNVM